MTNDERCKALFSEQGINLHDEPSGLVVHALMSPQAYKATERRGSPWEARYLLVLTVVQGDRTFEYVVRTSSLDAAEGFDAETREHPEEHLLPERHTLYLDDIEDAYESRSHAPAHVQKVAGKAALAIAVLLSNVGWDRRKAEADLVAQAKKGRKR